MLTSNPHNRKELETRTDGQKFAKNEAMKSKKTLLLVKLCFITVLVLSIIIIWTSLLSPLIIAYFTRPSFDNISRPYYDLLHHNLTDLMCNKSNPNSSINASNISCPDQYVFKCPVCLPICGVWHPFGDSYFKAYRVIAIIISIIDFTFSTIGMIIFVRVPGSLSFPKIIYFFLFLSLILLSIPLLIISIMGPHRFFCSLRTDDFKSVAASPSLLVTIFGAIAHYSFISFDFCFFIAALNIFIIIFFPHWQIMDSVKKIRGILIGEFIFCICIPLIFPFTQLVVYRQYTFTRLALLPFPLGDSITPFVMALGPLLFLTGIALTLIALSIYRVQIMKYFIYRTIIKFKSYEIRHIIFAIQVGFTVSFIFIELSIQFTNEAITDYLLEEFWACITIQNNPHFLSNQTLVPMQCPTSYKRYFHPILEMLGYLTTGVSAVEIVVILTTKETYEAWRRSFRKALKTISVRNTSIGLTATKS